MGRSLSHILSGVPALVMLALDHYLLCFAVAKAVADGCRQLLLVFVKDGVGTDKRTQFHVSWVESRYKNSLYLK